MKPLKVLCAIGILTLFFSCTYQEDSVAFFIDNQLNETLVVERTPENTAANLISENVTLDLRSSESYEKYIRGLKELEVVRFVCNFNNYQGTIESGKLYLDDFLLGNFDPNLDHVSVEDPEVLSRIAELFLERTSLDFSFVGESSSTHYLSVDVEVELKGTFVY